MRILILAEDPTQEESWAATLRDDDHTPLRVARECLSAREWFTRTKVEAARADCVLVSFTSTNMPETLAFLCGYAEAAGVQCVVISPHEGGLVVANPRNVRYDTFEAAMTRYFCTTRAARKKPALI